MENTTTFKKLMPLAIKLVKKNVPFMMWGGAGIGKTQFAKQVADAVGLELFTFASLIKQPVDLLGVPVPDMATQSTVWFRPEDIPSHPVLFFIDEVAALPNSMQAPLFQLVLERRCGKHHLHPDTRIVAAGNRLKDKAGAQRMLTPLRNRFSHWNVEADIASFSEHAASIGLSPYLIAFLNYRALLLHIMPGETVSDGNFSLAVSADANAFPSPRQWEQVNEFVAELPEHRQPLAASLVGDGPAAEFEGFMRTFHDGSLPTFEDMVAKPKTAAVPGDDNPAAKYAVAALICAKADASNFDALLEYAGRLGREFEMLVAITAPKTNPSLKATGAYTSWAVANQALAL